MLQVSSFRGSVSARAASDRLKARGIPSFFKYQRNQANSGWFAVYAGPYKDLKQAMQAASILEATEGKPPLLRRRLVD